jgi:hypothetical protein
MLRFHDSRLASTYKIDFKNNQRPVNNSKSDDDDDDDQSDVSVTNLKIHGLN